MKIFSLDAAGGARDDSRHVATELPIFNEPFCRGFCCVSVVTFQFALDPRQIGFGL
jgi:hypothetical protein